MVLSFGGGGGNVDELIARKRYGRALELLKEQLRRGQRNPRLRLQLADVLILAGRDREAVPVLRGLADEFALEGFAAKAIAVLKKAQKIERRPDVERRLAELIKQQREQGRPAPARTPAPPPIEFGIEEIEAEPPPPPRPPPPPPLDEAMIEEIGIEPPEPEPPPPAPQPVPEPVVEPEPMLEPQPEPVAAAPAEAPRPVVKVSEPPAASALPFEGDEANAFGEELLGVLHEVLSEVAATPPAPPPEGVPESPLFSDFSAEELAAVIGSLELIGFDPGDIIISQGEPGNSLFVLTSGVAKAFVRDEYGHNKPVRQMEEGSFFGEISILSGLPRTATVTAATRCELLELDRTRLDEITASHPRVMDVLRQFYEQRIAGD